MLCIDRPLEGGGVSQQELLVKMLRTAKDCEEYLWQSGEYDRSSTGGAYAMVLVSYRIRW